MDNISGKIIWFALFFIAIVLQTTVVPHFVIMGVYPDIIFILLFILSVEEGAMIGIWAGFGLGLILDINSEFATSLGVQSLSKTIIGATSGLVKEYWYSVTLYMQILFLAIIVVAHELISYFTMISIGKELPSVQIFTLNYILPKSLYIVFLCSLWLIYKYLKTPQKNQD